MNQKQRELTGVFLFIFIFSFTIFNWNDVSWIFNYRQLSGMIHDFFTPYNNSTLLVSANDNIQNLQITQPVAKATTISQFPYTDKPNSLEIPIIGLSTPSLIGSSTNISALTKDLDNGVVYYPGSVHPGEVGQMIILGHSAPPNWPHIKHDWVFSNIQSLNTGDEIIINFKNKQYVYRVTDKSIIKAGQDIQVNASQNNKNILTLVSCWPPGKNYQRITVNAELVTS